MANNACLVIYLLSLSFSPFQALAGQMTAPVKRKGRPHKKATYGSDASGRDDDDDMTDLSFHSDTGDQFSEEEDGHSVAASIGTGRKRGRPRSIKRARAEEKKEEKREESIAEKVVKTILGGDGDIDELGESRVDRDGHLLEGMLTSKTRCSLSFYPPSNRC